MRSISKYLGEGCLVTGSIDRWEFEESSNLARILLLGCTANGFSGWRHPEDHLWVQIPIEQFKLLRKIYGWSRLDMVAFTGVVSTYRRRNSTVDCGVAHDESFVRWSYFQQKIWARILATEDWALGIEMIDSGRIFNDYRDEPGLGIEFINYLASKRKWLQAQIDKPKLEFRATEPIFGGGRKKKSRGF